MLQAHGKWSLLSGKLISPLAPPPPPPLSPTWTCSNHSQKEENDTPPEKYINIARYTIFTFTVRVGKRNKWISILKCVFPCSLWCSSVLVLANICCPLLPGEGGTGNGFSARICGVRVKVWQQKVAPTSSLVLDPQRRVHKKVTGVLWGTFWGKTNFKSDLFSIE